MNATYSTSLKNLQIRALQMALCTLALAAALAGLPGWAINLTTELNHPAVETLVFQSGETRQITVNGRTYNTDPQGAFVPGGLQAFYYTGDFGTPRPLPDTPAGGEINVGRNSEFASNPTSSNNWWIQDNAAFRSANSISGTPTNSTLPPYIMRKFLAPSGATNGGATDNFSIRMEGQINVSAAGTYNFSGGADDRIRIYIDGQKVTDNGATGRYSGLANLAAGVHGFTAEFVEFGGGENYGFNSSGPGTVTFSANAQDQHTYSGATLELGRTFAEQRQGYLTGIVRANGDGTGPIIRDAFHFKGPASDDYGTTGGPSPQADNFRLILTGYWNVPQTGLFDFVAGADDLYSFAISDNPLDDPNAIAAVIDNNGTTAAPTSITGVSLSAGLKPVRFEFGENGGGANFNFLWSSAGLGTNNQFAANSLYTTDTPVFDYELLKTLQGQFTSLSDLYTFDIPEELLGQLLTMRLRAYGTDLPSANRLSSSSPPYCPSQSQVPPACSAWDYWVCLCVADELGLRNW